MSISSSTINMVVMGFEPPAPTANPTLATAARHQGTGAAARGGGGGVTAGEAEQPLRLGDWLLAAAVAALVLALVAVAAVSTDRLDRAERHLEAAEASGRVSAGVGVGLETGLRGVAAAARNVPAVGLAAVAGAVEDIAPGATDVGFVPLSGEVPVVVGPSPLAASARQDEAVAAVLDRARDSARAQLGPPIETADGPRSPLIAAAYRAGEVPGPPVSSVDRRVRLVGWVVALVDIEALAERHRPGGARVVVHDGGAAGSGDGATGDASQVVEVAGRTLVVGATVGGDRGITTGNVAAVIAGGLLAAAGAALVLVSRRRERASLALADDRGAQVRLIGDVAPLVQQSLELAEVLPAVAVQLSDHFDLAGVTLSTGSSRAGQTELFSVGLGPDPDVKATLQPPEQLLAGQTLNLALQRGGRSVALLQVVAGRTLDTPELESLRALSELVTAAMVNAALYASQQDAIARMQDLDALKTVFLGTASHELRTPATAIAGFAGLLTSSWDRFSDEQRRDFVDRIGANARSLSAVVQDLLDFSLLDRGTLALSLEPLELGAVVQGVLDRLAPTFGDHALEADLAPTAPVEGDRNGLERITTNLLTNAVKFSPAGTTIGIAVRQDGDHVLLEVRDQGPGVPPEERERVFTRFYRGSGDAVLATRGVGIGLSVVSEFVARMRGEVRVDDAPGGGACFTVRLPSAEPATIEEVADATAR
jgi:signal transduction histidine kinase